MAAFSGLNFIFDGKSSEEYGVKIVYINKSGWNTDNMGADFEPILADNPLGISKPSYGINISQLLEFNITIGSLRPLNRHDVHKISSWLFARRKPCRLYIDQHDMKNIYYECYLTTPQMVSMANYPYAFSCTVSCTSPFAWSNDIIKTAVVSDDNTEEIHLLNWGADIDGFILPKVEIAPESNISTISLINENDSGKEFLFDFTGNGTIAIVNGEIITVDNLNQIVSSSEYYNRLEAFNKKWLRLANGDNKIKITGNGTYTFTYRVPIIAGV